MLPRLLRLALDPLDRFGAKLEVRPRDAAADDAVLYRGELLRVELLQEEGRGLRIGEGIGRVWRIVGGALTEDEVEAEEEEEARVARWAAEERA